MPPPPPPGCEEPKKPGLNRVKTKSDLIFRSHIHKTKDNFTKGECKALKDLKNNTKIYLKKADKDTTHGCHEQRRQN